MDPCNQRVSNGMMCARFFGDDYAKEHGKVPSDQEILSHLEGQKFCWQHRHSLIGAARLQAHIFLSQKEIAHYSNLFLLLKIRDVEAIGWGTGGWTGSSWKACRVLGYCCRLPNGLEVRSETIEGLFAEGAKKLNARIEWERRQAEEADANVSVTH
jgi:hypothetical protein